MAEKSLLNILINKLATIVEHKVQLVMEFPAESESFRKDLEVMMRILKHNENKLQDKDESFKECMRQLKEAANMAVDFFDDLKDPQSLNLLKIHQKATKLQSIRSKVSSAVKRTMEYEDLSNRLSDPGPSSRRIIDTTEEDKLLNPRHHALLTNESEHSIIGFDEHKEKLISWLVEGDDGSQSQVRVISVHGMGGLGKTTLAKIVSDEARVKNHFQIIEWFTISKPFNIDELLKEMIRVFSSKANKEVPQGVETMKIHFLINFIKELLRRTSSYLLRPNKEVLQGVETMESHLLIKIIKELLRRTSNYLLVFDDVWGRQEWEDINRLLPKDSCGRVLITTRFEDVAKSSSKAFKGSHIYKLDFLSPEYSMKLFCKKMSLDSCPPETENICKKILGKCRGLPLAITAICGLLSTKAEEQWETIYRGLGAHINEDRTLRKDITEVLSLSFDDLEKAVASCFFYLCIFPEDHPIEYNRLLRLIVAEGSPFLEAKEGLTLEEVGDSNLKELLNRGLLQVTETTSEGKVKVVRLHGILRDIIIPRSRDQLEAVIATASKLEWSHHMVRRLSIHNTMETVPNNIDLSHLLSLFMFKMAPAAEPYISKFLNSRNLERLNVLDLQYAPLNKFPKVVVNLIHLSYLSLRNTMVNKIPASIKNLKNLQTLDLKHTRVTKLPNEIQKLTQLRHLLVYRYNVVSFAEFHYKYGFKPPSHIGRLQSLQKLCFLDVSQCKDDIVFKELGKLQNLTRLGIIKLKKRQGDPLCCAIKLLKNLIALSITSFSDKEIIDLKNLDSDPPTSLRRLYLTGRLQKLPEWISGLPQLYRLYLKWNQLEQDPIQDLKDLPNLIHLELHQACIGEKLRFTAGGFKKLKHLGLDNFDNLQSIDIEGDAIPSLERLIIQRCGKLSDVPSGIQYLNLKLLHFYEMPDDFIEKLRSSVKDDIHSKIAHVPLVTSSRWIVNDWSVENLIDQDHAGTETGTGNMCWK